jgi:hypothetical protein
MAHVAKLDAMRSTVFLVPSDKGSPVFTLVAERVHRSTVAFVQADAFSVPKAGLR